MLEILRRSHSRAAAGDRSPMSGFINQPQISVSLLEDSSVMIDDATCQFAIVQLVKQLEFTQKLAVQTWFQTSFPRGDFRRLFGRVWARGDSLLNHRADVGAGDPAGAAGMGADQYEVFVLGGHGYSLCFAEDEGCVAHEDGGYAGWSLVDQDHGFVHVRLQQQCIGYWQRNLKSAQQRARSPESSEA